MQSVGRAAKGEMCEAGHGEEGICAGLEVRREPFTQCWNKVWKVMLGKAAHHRDLEPKKGDEGFLNRDLFLSLGRVRGMSPTMSGGGTLRVLEAEQVREDTGRAGQLYDKKRSVYVGRITE